MIHPLYGWTQLHHWINDTDRSYSWYRAWSTKTLGKEYRGRLYVSSNKTKGNAMENTSDILSYHRETLTRYIPEHKICSICRLLSTKLYPLMHSGRMIPRESNWDPSPRSYWPEAILGSRRLNCQTKSRHNLRSRLAKVTNLFTLNIYEKISPQTEASPGNHRVKS